MYAVNATPMSVTLLWTEEGVVDYYQVVCKPSRSSDELKVSSFMVLSAMEHSSSVLGYLSKTS